MLSFLGVFITCNPSHFSHLSLNNSFFFYAYLALSSLYSQYEGHCRPNFKSDCVAHLLKTLQSFQSTQSNHLSVTYKALPWVNFYHSSALTFYYCSLYSSGFSNSQHGLLAVPQICQESSNLWPFMLAVPFVSLSGQTQGSLTYFIRLFIRRAFPDDTIHSHLIRSLSYCCPSYCFLHNLYSINYLFPYCIPLSTREQKLEATQWNCWIQSLP